MDFLCRNRRIAGRPQLTFHSKEGGIPQIIRGPITLQLELALFGSCFRIESETPQRACHTTLAAGAMSVE